MMMIIIIVIIVIKIMIVCGVNTSAVSLVTLIWMGFLGIRFEVRVGVNLPPV